MSKTTTDHLFGWWTAFDSPFVLWMSIATVAVLVFSGTAILTLNRLGKLGPGQYADLWPRWKSWLWLAFFMLMPTLLGAAWVMLAVLVLSLWCFSEFARATGLFREKVLVAVAAFGIFALAFANLDNFDRLYFALGPITVAFLAICTIPQDRPKGYIQRVALAVMAFLLFGHALGYLGLIANSPLYRSLILLILAGVELNDVFAYCVGKTVGGPKSFPNTSPHKTIAGHLGALALTSTMVGLLGHIVLAGTPADRIDVLVILGIGMSLFGQCGDLILSSIKRDLGLKDIGVSIPGHGGILDRFNSLVLVPPVFFHFLSLYMRPLNSAVAERILTGG